MRVDEHQLPTEKKRRAEGRAGLPNYKEPKCVTTTDELKMFDDKEIRRYVYFRFFLFLKILETLKKLFLV